MGIYVQFSVLLLLTAAMIMIVLSMSACDSCGTRSFEMSWLDNTFIASSQNDIFRVYSEPNSFQFVLTL